MFVLHFVNDSSYEVQKVMSIENLCSQEVGLRM